MFDHDRSAARGEMSTRGLYVFKHDSELGNAPAFSLFSRISVKRKEDIPVPRANEDYVVLVDDTEMKIGAAAAPQSGVTLSRLA